MKTNKCTKENTHSTQTFFKNRNKISQLHTENPYYVLPELLSYPFTMDHVFDASWLDKYAINDIATTLVHRLYVNKDKEANNDEATYFKTIDLRLNFPGNIIENLQESAEFLNTHQTGTSGGYGSKNRAIIEASFLNMPYELFKPDKETLDYNSDKRLHFLRPKYVFCHDATQSNLAAVLNSFQYGNFSAVLEDHVKYRTTYSAYDSLIPIIDNPTYSFYSCNQNAQPHEGQVYGHITIEEDVKHFIVNLMALVFETQALELLKHFNKPIYNSVTGNLVFSPRLPNSMNIQ
jgi:hypothetical protein